MLSIILFRFAIAASAAVLAVATDGTASGAGGVLDMSVEGVDGGIWRCVAASFVAVFIDGTASGADGIGPVLEEDCSLDLGGAGGAGGVLDASVEGV